MACSKVLSIKLELLLIMGFREFQIPPDFYEEKLPYFMKMDWINFERWTMDKENPVDGDYKFVYFGSPGSRYSIFVPA